MPDLCHVSRRFLVKLVLVVGCLSVPGIAAGQSVNVLPVPKMTEIAKDAPPFEYVPAKLAFCPRPPN